MKRLLVLIGVVAVLLGGLAGYLWWGLPAGRLGSELREIQARADRLDQQVGELREQGRQLEAQLKAEQTRREAAERDLRAEKETSSRLHTLVSEGKK